MDLISIIIPAYNAEKFLDRCLKSVLEQTYKNIEVIIIDDGSSDKTLEIARRHGKEDSRVKVYHQSNQGVSSARNFGLKNASGKYIQFIDADDYTSKDMLEFMHAEYKEDIDVVICGFKRSDGSVKTQKLSESVVLLNNISASAHLFYRYSYQGFCWNKLFKSEIIYKNNIQFDSEITNCDDLVFCCEYFKYIRKAAYLPMVFYQYIANEYSATDTSRFNEKRYSILHAFDKIERLQAGRADSIRKAMYNHLATDCIVLTKMTIKYHQPCMRRILCYIKRTGWYYLLSDWKIKFKIAYVFLKSVSYFTRKTKPEVF